MKKALLIFVIVSFCISCSKENTIVEPKVKIYETVTIGNQVWMVKNLDVDHYRNGDQISEVRDQNEWSLNEKGAWCYYDNSSDSGVKYGKLYNWYAVIDPRGLAPAGFHIPSDEEWSILNTYLGGVGIAGGKLKESDLTHWFSPNIGATNESGFSALPGGMRFSDSPYGFVGSHGVWWSTSGDNVSGVWCRYLYHDNAGMGRNHGAKKNAFSVRCIKDN